MEMTEIDNYDIPELAAQGFASQQRDTERFLAESAFLKVHLANALVDLDQARQLLRIHCPDDPACRAHDASCDLAPDASHKIYRPFGKIILAKSQRVDTVKP